MNMDKMNFMLIEYHRIVKPDGWKFFYPLHLSMKIMLIENYINVMVFWTEI